MIGRKPLSGCRFLSIWFLAVVISRLYLPKETASLGSEIRTVVIRYILKNARTKKVKIYRLKRFRTFMSRAR